MFQKFCEITRVTLDIFREILPALHLTLPSAISEYSLQTASRLWPYII